MSKWNIAAKSQEERDKVNVDLAASGVAYKERLNMPVVAEVVVREHPAPPRIRSALSGNGQSERQKVVLIFLYQPAIITSPEPEQLR